MEHAIAHIKKVINYKNIYLIKLLSNFIIYMNIESRILNLRSTDINSSVTHADYYNTTIVTAYGKVEENRTKLTWTNIDMRQVLGDMFDKYDRFNISLNFVGTSETGTATETISDLRFFQVILSGLSFTTTYNHSYQSSDNKALMGLVNFPLISSTAYITNQQNPSTYTFDKSQNVSLTIDLLNITDNDYYIPVGNTSLIGHTIFSFTITGVDAFEKEKLVKNYDVRDITSNRTKI
jgi:hypothetical protein